MMTARAHRGIVFHARRGLTGFSLIELMTVLIIVGILAVIATPAFTSMIANQRARGAAAGLHTALLKTRSEAVKRNANITLAASGGSWVAGWQILDAANKVLDDHEPVSGVSITGGPASVVYQSSGRIQGAAPAFLVTSTAVPTVKKCVSADTSGRPYSKEC